MGKQSFLQGAFVLVFASILVKALGFLYQIFIVRLIGTEGIGIFNMVYPLYIAAQVIVTAGLPLAISKYVSAELARNDRISAEKILGEAVAVVVLIATVGAFLLIIYSPEIITVFYSDPRVIPSFLILVPTLLLVAVSSCVRGYFNGTQDMRPAAATQLIEQVIRFICGLSLVYVLYPYGLTWTAVGLSTAILLSEAGGLIYLIRLFRAGSMMNKILLRPRRLTLGKLFSFGIPIAVTRLILTLVSAAEASLIPRQLMKAGLTLSKATSFYGELTGVAFTLLMVPSTLTFSLSTSILPAISEAESRRQKELLCRRTTDAIGVTLLAGVPSAIILYFWGPYLASQLFKAEQAGLLLKILAFGSVFLYLAQTSSGILQGIGCVKTIFGNTLASGIIRLGGICYFGSQPFGGPAGIAFSYVGSFMLLAFLNLLVITRKAGLQLEPLFFLRLLAAGFLLAELLKACEFLVQDSILLLVLLTISCGLSFFLLLFVTGDKYTRLILNQLIKGKKA